MLFRLDVRTDDNDYLEFNKFHALRSPYRKNPYRSLQVIMGVLVGVLCIRHLVEFGFTPGALCRAIPTLIAGALLIAFMPKIWLLSLKNTVKQMTKNGKPAYHPAETLEFDEDIFTQSTEEERSEMKYSLIERVSVVDEKYIYLHTAAIRAQILPVSAFESREQYEAFLAFIATKCDKVDVYPPKGKKKQA